MLSQIIRKKKELKPLLLSHETKKFLPEVLAAKPVAEVLVKLQARLGSNMKGFQPVEDQAFCLFLSSL